MDSIADRCSPSRMRRNRAAATRKRLWISQQKLVSQQYAPCNYDYILYALNDIHSILLQSSVHVPTFVPYCLDPCAEHVNTDGSLLEQSGQPSSDSAQEVLPLHGDASTEIVVDNAPSEVTTPAPATDVNIVTTTDACPVAQGDQVHVSSGPMQGYVGRVIKPGGVMTVVENGVEIKFDTHCSVALDGDPANFPTRSLHESVLEKFDVTREQLQSSADGLLRAMEAGTIPHHRHSAVIPLVRKAAEYAKTGTPKQCRTIEQVLSERLSQLAEDIFVNPDPESA